MNPHHIAYNAFAAADDAWSAELVRAFGKRASEARYTAEGKGEPGTPLRAASDAFHEARKAWHRANHLPTADLIAREQAKPFTHRVVTHYETGATRTHDTRGLAQAENFATGQRRKMDRYLIDRESGGYVNIVAVTIEEITV